MQRLTKFKHSTGPWFRTPRGLQDLWGEDVVMADSGIALGRDRGFGREKANGVLVERSPELLDALKNIILVLKDPEAGQIAINLTIKDAVTLLEEIHEEQNA